MSVRVAEMVCVGVAVVALPVTSRTKVPRGALLLVVILSVVVPPAATTEAGAKLALVPGGRPLTVRLTDPVKLPWDKTETADVVEEPRLMLRELGLIARPKSGGGLTTSVARVVCVVEPLVPLIVSG